MSLFARTPEPPYYAVVFTAAQTATLDGYEDMVVQMKALAAAEPGYLGVESVQEREGEITVSYWRDLDSIAAWKRQIEHLGAQTLGRARWYEAYRVRIARVERAYGFGVGPD
jgi:heme-degrading monooxygenase HmoA